MADDIDSGGNEKSLYLIQIQYLDEQLERCQFKYDELEKQNKDLISQYNAQVKDKKNIIEPLKRSLVAKEKKVDELDEQLEIQQTIAKDTEALKLQYSQQIQELKEQVDELNIVTMAQEAKSEEQRDQLMRSTEPMESMKKQLVSQKREHEVTIHRLMMETELEKEKRTEEMEKKVEESVQKKTSDILREERAQYGERLERVEFLLNQSMIVREDIDFLRVKVRELCSKRDDLKKDVSKITSENFIWKMEEKQLRTMCHNLEADLKDCIITYKHMLAKEEELRQDLASVSEECRLKTVEAGQLGTELQRERSRSRQLDRIAQEAVIILRHIMAESEKGSDTQWKKERLLDILESPAPLGTVPTFNVSTKKSSRESKDH